MSEHSGFDSKALHAGGDELPELELSDEDILDAMQHIPGYLDVSTTDFREIYHLAHRHALQRLFAGVNAGSLMRVGVEPVRPDATLERAAAVMARQGLKAVPVVDSDERLVGMLTETDYLRRLRADTFLELLLRLVSDVNSFLEEAGFFEIISAFHRHEGRSMPVVDGDGRLRGLLLRKDFVHAYHLEELL
ncbi:MAG: CBS domain-containing protein [Gammaproteobacteria bacterium]